MAHLVGCCVYDVCCVLCFVLQPTTRRLYLYFSDVIFSSFQLTARWLNLFFPVVIYSNWWSCQNTNTNYNPKKLWPKKKDTVVWPAMIFKLGEKLTTGKKGTVVWPTVENHLSCQNTNTPITTGKIYGWKKEMIHLSGRLLCQNTNTSNHTLI